MQIDETAYESVYESICLVYGILFSQNAYEIEEVKKENLDFKAVLRFWLIHGEMLIKEWYKPQHEESTGLRYCRAASYTQEHENKSYHCGNRLFSVMCQIPQNPHNISRGLV